MSSIALVEPVTTARALRGPFDYRLPEDLRGGVVDVGSMLVVPFARRQVLGVVVGLAERSEVDERKLLVPTRALDQSPPTLPVELVALAQWIAAEYCSTIARALMLVLPPGATRRLSGRKRSAVRVRTAHPPVGAGRAQAPPPTVAQERALAALVQALDRRRHERRLLQGVTGSGKTEVYLRAAERALAQERGVIVLVPEIALTPQIVTRFQERFGETVAVMHSRLRQGERYEEWQRLRTGRARVCVGPRSAVFAPIERLGLIVVDEEHDASYKHEGDPRYDARDVAEHRAETQGAVLLLGSATPRPESVWRASARRDAADGCTSASGHTPADGHTSARGHTAADGHTSASGRVAAGASKATSESSAGRSLASAYASRPAGDGSLLRLSERVDGRALPHVSVLDMRDCESAGLHPETTRALAQVRTQRGKAIVLLNRRGWSNFLSCRTCGHVWSCPQCDVSLVLHNASARIACHHCGHREPTPDRCRQCGSISVARHGAGTERVQHDLAAALDGEDERFPVLRLDADTVAGEGGSGTLLHRFQEAPAGVLIGTQMVAKGHDFPGVTLGVVLDADATLRFPDFRAEERTFALIAQLAGRVGRGSEGRVLVQTVAPDARSIAYAAGHDSDGFLAGELARREALSYPPFSHLIRIVCAAEESTSARTAATALAERLRSGLLGATTADDARARAYEAEPSMMDVGAQVLGPAALFRLRGQERQMLLVKAPERRPAVRAVGEELRAVADDRKHRGVSFSVDVDPQ